MENWEQYLMVTYMLTTTGTGKLMIGNEHDRKSRAWLNLLRGNDNE